MESDIFMHVSSGCLDDDDCATDETCNARTNECRKKSCPSAVNRGIVVTDGPNRHLVCHPGQLVNGTDRRYAEVVCDMDSDGMTSLPLNALRSHVPFADDDYIWRLAGESGEVAACAPGCGAKVRCGDGFDCTGGGRCERLSACPRPAAASNGRVAPDAPGVFGQVRGRIRPEKAR